MKRLRQKGDIYALHTCLEHATWLINWRVCILTTTILKSKPWVTVPLWLLKYQYQPFALFLVICKWNCLRATASLREGRMSRWVRRNCRDWVGVIALWRKLSSIPLRATRKLEFWIKSRCLHLSFQHFICLVMFTFIFPKFYLFSDKINLMTGIDSSLMVIDLLRKYLSLPFAFLQWIW